MKNVDISSMFLVPKNIYTSMLSRIHDDDVKEDINSLNRKKDDGNYIEKAIDFNNQQERQNNQIFIKPNLTNETVRTNANTNVNTSAQNINETVRTNANTDANTSAQNLNQTVATTESFHTPLTNQTQEVVASTPKRTRAFSRIRGLVSPMLPIPIEDTLLEKNTEGYFTCDFCNKQFREANELQDHYLKIHNQDLTKEEHSSISNKNLENAAGLNLDDSDVGMITLEPPTNVNMSSFENTGAIPKTKNVENAVGKKLDDSDVRMTTLDDIPISTNIATFKNIGLIPKTKNVSTFQTSTPISKKSNTSKRNDISTGRKNKKNPYSVPSSKVIRESKKNLLNPFAIEQQKKNINKKRKYLNNVQENIQNPNKKRKISTEIKESPPKTKKEEYETTGYKKKKYISKYGRHTSRLFLDKIKEKKKKKNI